MHLPQGFARERNLRRQPLLAGLPYQILTLLLDENDPRHEAHGWRQEGFARLLGVSMHAVKVAFRKLTSGGYYRAVRRSLGNSRWQWFWCVTDEPGEWGDADRRIAAEVAAMLDGRPPVSPQVISEVDQQPLTDDLEPPCSSGVGSESSSPPAPAVGGSSPGRVDNSRTRAPRTPHQQLARRMRSRERLKVPVLPGESLNEVAHRAVKLAHDLRVPQWMRAEVAGYVGICLRAGDGETELLHAFSHGLETATHPAGAARWRAQARAHGHDPHLTAEVKALADQRYGRA